MIAGPGSTFVEPEIELLRGYLADGGRMLVLLDPTLGPDGELVTYRSKREGDEHTTLWAIPVDGGESKRIVEFDSDILAYELSPGGEGVHLGADLRRGGGHHHPRQ